MTIKDLVLAALKFAIPATLVLFVTVWLWTTFGRIASGTIPSPVPASGAAYPAEILR